MVKEVDGEEINHSPFKDGDGKGVMRVRGKIQLKGTRTRVGALSRSRETANWSWLGDIFPSLLVPGCASQGVRTMSRLVIYLCSLFQTLDAGIVLVF